MFDTWLDCVSAMLRFMESAIWHSSEQDLTTQAWMDMIKSRNETTQKNVGSMADEVVDSIINRFYPLLAEFYQKMNSLSALTPDDLFSK